MAMARHVSSCLQGHVRHMCLYRCTKHPCPLRWQCAVCLGLTTFAVKTSLRITTTKHHLQALPAVIELYLLVPMIDPHHTCMLLTRVFLWWAGYSPTSPGYSPTSPGYSPTSPGIISHLGSCFAFTRAMWSPPDVCILIQFHCKCVA